MISTELRGYLADYLAWIERGSPANNPYMRCAGLCSNLARYPLNSYKIRRELTAVLTLDFGDRRFYPFGGEHIYDIGVEKHTQHLNEGRIDWVRKQLEENI